MSLIVNIAIMKKGFSLIEILVVIAVIAALTGITMMFTQSSRSTSRDEQRKIELQTIQTGLEEFRAHCGTYLSNHSYQTRVGGPLTGVDWVAAGTGHKTCISSNVFMDEIPDDPQSPERAYRYNRSSTGQGYVICAALENPPTPAMDVSTCGGRCGNHDCNYVMKSPHQ